MIQKELKKEFKKNKNIDKLTYFDRIILIATLLRQAHKYKEQKEQTTKILLLSDWIADTTHLDHVSPYTEAILQAHLTESKEFDQKITRRWPKGYSNLNIRIPDYISAKLYVVAEQYAINKEDMIRDITNILKKENKA